MEKHFEQSANRFPLRFCARLAYIRINVHIYSDVFDVGVHLTRDKLTGPSLHLRLSPETANGLSRFAGAQTSFYRPRLRRRVPTDSGVRRTRSLSPKYPTFLHFSTLIHPARGILQNNLRLTERTRTGASSSQSRCSKSVFGIVFSALVGFLFSLIVPVPSNRRRGIFNFNQKSPGGGERYVRTDAGEVE